MERIDAYIDYISGIRRYSVRTQQIYRDVLERFARYVEPEDLVQSLNAQIIRSYEVHLMKDEGLDARTVGLHLSVLSGFSRFLMKSGQLSANPVRGITRPKVSKRLPVFYREDSMEEYFESTSTYGSRTVLDLLSGRPEDKMDLEIYSRVLERIIISLLYGTGMRRSELISLERSGFDPSRKVIRVLGKGDKMREIPVTASLCGEISLYLDVARKTGFDIDRKDGLLLLTHTGRGLYPAYVDKAVKNGLGTVPSITARRSPHVLRHTIATELLDDGADINSIKEMLGHSSLAATQVYTHNSIEKLKKVYNQAHPRCRSSKKQ